ncbi:30S ribosomal protein S6 [Lyngbya aestuarii]|uniref:30S ribosomal protein S6 n=1 Tax=Lyngbya aestuarii TaxID=118322 RepID=UPI00403D8773
MLESYELMYVLRPDLGEEQVNETITKYQNLLGEYGAQETEIQHRGRRRLAYEIKRCREGIYVQVNYKAPGNHVAPVERAMRLSEEVIRYLTLKQEVLAPTPEPAEVES